MLRRWFQAHPQSVGESYLEHQQVAFGFSGALLKAGLACFVHGLLPCLFQTTASRTIIELHQKMAARNNQAVPVTTPPDLKRLVAP